VLEVLGQQAGELMLSCPACDRSFDTKRALGAHRTQAHGWRRPGREGQRRCRACQAELVAGTAVAVRYCDACREARAPRRAGDTQPGGGREGSLRSGSPDPCLSGSAAGRAALDSLLRRIEGNECSVEGYADLVEGGRRLREARVGKWLAA
jgi:uncharacterized C2H2 Zn-finger protein